MNFFQAFSNVVRAAIGRWQHATAGWSFVPGRSQIDWQAGVGDGTGNSAVLACLRALCAAFTEAPLRLERRTKDGYDAVPDHPLLDLFEAPNPHLSDRLLWWAVLASVHLDGNAYLVKLRSGAGRPVELWPVFPNAMEPVWPEGDPSVFIGAYEYTGGHGERQYIHPDDVIHFRWGLDPNNVRKGFSPLRALLRDIYTDNEAGDFSAQLLTNLGIPGVVLSPDSDVPISAQDAEVVKARFLQRFHGDSRGAPLVMAGRTKVEVLSFSPDQLNFADLRRIPETRIAAVLGVPAIVAGLDAGLQRSTFANFAEAREAFYENTIVPLQEQLAADLRRQLLRDFGPTKGLYVRFDRSQVRILQEDEDKRHARIWGDWERGLLTLTEARMRLDPALPALPTEAEVLAVPSSLTLTPVDAVGVPPAAPALPAPSDPNGDGAAPVEEDQDPPEPEKAEGRALPAPETKATDPDQAFGDALRRLRADAEDAFERVVADSLTALAGRVAGRLDGRKGDEVPPIESLLPKSEDAALTNAWRASYVDLLTVSWPVLNERLGVSVDFSLDDGAVKAALKGAGERIRGINETTRTAVRAALIEGQAAGEGIDQLAKRVRGVVEESYRGRAVTISRTELGTCQQEAAVGRYKAAGITKVKVLDGTNDDICRPLNGTIQTLQWAAANLIGHPRCVRCHAPVVEE